MLDDSHKRKSLGRGLGALLGGDMDFMTSENAVHAAGEKNVSLADLSPSPYQPRLDFDREALEALSQSVREKGVLQPLLVRERENGKYEIIAGERRFRAASMAGLTEVPVIVKSMDDKEVLEVALVENLLRENLSAIEEAEGLQRLIDEFSHTQEALSQIIGKSRSHIANTLRLLSLPASVRQMIRDGVLTAGQARPLVGLPEAEALAKKIAERGLNARQAEALAARAKLPETEKRTAEKDGDLEEISSFMTRNLGLKVKISAGRGGGGKVVLQYANPADLDKIIDILRQKSTLTNDTRPERKYRDGNGSWGVPYQTKAGIKRRSFARFMDCKNTDLWTDKIIDFAIAHIGSRTSFDDRLSARVCELCGKTNVPLEIHHVNKVKNLKGKQLWELAMIAKKRKTLAVCKDCHHKIHHP